jgi:F-type H+-transporting ATPase subunit delta
MKLTPKNYAKILYLSTAGLPEEKIEDVVKNFIKLLIKNNNLNLIEKIINEFEKFSKKESGFVQLKLTSAFPLDSKIIEKISAFLNLKKEQTEIEMQIDKNLIGGFILKFDDRILDASVRGKLGKIKSMLK